MNRPRRGNFHSDLAYRASARSSAQAQTCVGSLMLSSRFLKMTVKGDRGWTES